MHITVSCPRCLREYHLDDSLRGQQIRCPNPMCRDTFEVRPETSQPAPPARAIEELISDQAGLQPLPDEQVPPGGSPGVGSVGDFVEILPAEVEGKDLPMAEIVEPEPPKPSSSQVGEIVTLLPAEPAHTPEAAPPPPPAPREEVPNWRQPPPVRAPNKADKPGGKSAPGRRPEPASASPTLPQQQPDRPKTGAETVKIIPGTPFEVYSEPAPAGAADNGQQTPPAGPVELPPGAWEAPPVRGPDGEESAPAVPYPAPDADMTVPVAAEEDHGEVPPVHYDDDLEHAVPTRRWGRRLLIGILGLGLAAGVALLLVYFDIFAKSEQKRYDTAKAEYDAGKFGDAAKHFRELTQDEKLAESPRKAEYAFLADLSEVRDAIEGLSPELDKGPGLLSDFLHSHAGDPLVKDNREDIWKSCKRLIEVFTAQATQSRTEAKPAFRQARQSLKKAEQWLADAPRYVKVSQSEIEPLEDAIRKEDQAIAQAQHRSSVLASLRALHRTFEGLKDFKQSMERERLDQDPEVLALYREFRDAVVNDVTYERAKSHRVVKPPAEEPSMVVGEAAPPGLRNEGVVFALARGLLSALDQGTGKTLWTTRVGIDTFSLPVRLGLDARARETVLVLSSDTNTLTARDARTGEVRWAHDLGKKPSLGRPVVIGQLAYVPTYDGTVHEIELAQGRLVGRFKLGLPLSIGGVRQPGTNLLYFPADSQAVYVLDVAAHTCVAILLTEHPAGSLRGEPIIISRDGVRQAFGQTVDEFPDYLVLNQTDGLNAMRLRVFRLADKPRDSAEEAPDSEPRIPGWSQFAPYHDAEKLLQFTDSGKLAYIGIKQIFNQDKPLFVQSINDLLEGKDRRPAASQVVYASEDDIWVLAGGELQRRHYDKFGQRLPPLWQDALPLGSPLHDSQVGAGGKNLFLVTQSLTQQHCLATAVNADDGNVVWQRQLGLVCQGDPLVLEHNVLVLDQGGALYLFDPRQPPAHLNGPWQAGGRLLAEALPQGAIASTLRLGPGGGAAYQITTVDRGAEHDMDRYQLVVRRYEPGKELFQKTIHRWPDLLRGTPGVESNSILLPLANGNLRRQVLDKDSGEDGPEWRAERADEVEARGHVVVIDDGESLVTDGSKGLMRLHWPVGQAAKFEKRTTITLPARIVAAPLLLPRDKDHPDLRALVADADGNVTLVQGDKLDIKRQWKLKDKITTGPYLLGGSGRRIACIVDGRRLVSLDPQENDWREYRTPGEGIVGRPQLVGDVLVVADRQGTFVALDPATAKPLRQPGYSLRANIAPAANPVAFGPDLIFAPLTDGAVLLLPQKALRPPAK